MEEAIIGSINYRLNEGTKTAEVIRKENGYEGDIIIPETVVLNERTYRVTSIGEGAFYQCESLKSIIIPDSVTSIGEGVFLDCGALKSINVAQSNTNYDSRENCNAIIETSTNTLICGCQNTTIPNSVTSIGKEAFYACTSLLSITIPDSVTSIGAMAFECCTSLTKIVIPDNVKSIGGRAFSRCNSLESIVIGNSVTSVGNSAFCDCFSLTDITIPDSVTSIEDYAFFFCKSLNAIHYDGTIAQWGNITLDEDWNGSDATVVHCTDGDVEI